MKKKILLAILNIAFLILNCSAQNRTADSLLTLIKNDKNDTNKVNHLNALATALRYQNPDTAIILGNQALNILTPIFSSEFPSKNYKEENAMKLLRANTLGNIGVYYNLKADYSQSIDYSMKALKLHEELKNKKGITNCLGNIGNVYLSQGDYLKALDFHFKALKIDEEIKDKKGIAADLCNIGIVYWEQADYTKALDYYFKSLKIDEELENKNGIMSDFANIGLVYHNQNHYSQALDYDFKALKKAEQLGYKEPQENILGNIGNVYLGQGDYLKALDYYFKALKMSKELGDKDGTARHLGNIGSLYIITGKFKEAEQYIKKANALSDSIGALYNLGQTEELLSQLYDTTGRYKEALIHYKKAMALQDTLFSQENKKQLVRKEMNYEFDKKEAATKAEHDKEIAVEESEKKKQHFILILVSCVLILVFLFAGFIFRSLRITRSQKNIIELQKNEVSNQKELVEKQKEKIVDSITYAQRIQQSILMEESEIRNYLPESFIYFQPKDIVSGDFYWFSKVEGRSEIGEQRLENDSQLPTPDSKLIIAAVDCTGHGVPGAFMSMIGNTLLNQIVNEKHITTPSEILKHLNTGVYEALHQKKDGALSDDGMDIALCSIDYKNKELQYAGAQNPLYIVSNGEIEIIKANIQGIGGGGMFSKKTDPLKKEFTNHVIPIKKDMSIYLFTDGYADQFGGLERKKFGTQKFKELLLNNQQLNMQKQKELLASAHTEWKGNTIQIDDILVIGVRI